MKQAVCPRLSDKRGANRSRAFWGANEAGPYIEKIKYAAMGQQALP
jgi:hypothetical protein